MTREEVRVFGVVPFCWIGVVQRTLSAGEPGTREDVRPSMPRTRRIIMPCRVAEGDGIDGSGRGVDLGSGGRL